jgi:hypothetical protein
LSLVISIGLRLFANSSRWNWNQKGLWCVYLSFFWHQSYSAKMPIGQILSLLK